MTEAIERNRQEFSERAERIRSDRDLSGKAKRRKISEAYEEATRRHQELVGQLNKAADKEIRDLERSVFAISYPHEANTWRDREAVRQSYRDAAFRAFGASTQDLDRMLHRAERVGDKQLGRAVYHEALERGINSVMETYWELHPETKDRYSRYAARQGRARRRIGKKMISSSGIPEPREVHDHRRRLGA